MDFLKWYKNKAESNNQEPPENIWKNIQDELDIDQSWLFINNKLNKKTFINRQFLFAAAASILFFIVAGGYWFLKPQLKIDNIEKISENTEVAENQKTVKSERKNHIKNKEEKQTLIIEVKDQNKPYYKTKNEELIVADLQNQQTNDAIFRNDNQLAFLDRKPGKVDYQFVMMNDLKKSNKNQQKQEEKSERTSFKKMYLGTTGQLANTWLLNEKTYNGLESSNLTTANTSFGYNFGLFVGTNISKRIDMQFDLNILANNNQDYNEYLNGHYVSSQLKFNYSQVALSFRYYIMSKRFMKGEHGVNMGGYFGYLHNAYQVIDGKSFSIQNSYTDIDYGLFLGYEYIVPISNKLGFGTGFRAYYGLQNIFAGDDYIPAYMNKTNNASINITLSLKYNLR